MIVSPIPNSAQGLARRIPLTSGSTAGSPAVNAGAPLPKEWLDPLRHKDHGLPDIGAIPLNQEPWTVGPQTQAAIR